MLGEANCGLFFLSCKNTCLQKMIKTRSVGKKYLCMFTTTNKPILYLMKKRLKLLPLLAVLITTAFFVQCAKDDTGMYDENARHFGPQMQRPAVYLEGAEKQKAIQALNNIFARAGRNAPRHAQRSDDSDSQGWTVEFDEILLVSDSLGRKNFTYRVNHPLMDETIFYNLVHTEYVRDEKYRVTAVKLVMYQMTPTFAADYKSGEKGMDSFVGAIRFTPVTETETPIFNIEPPQAPDPVPDEPVDPPLKPCDEEVVIVVPPAGPDNPNPSPVQIPGGSPSGSGGFSDADLSYVAGEASAGKAGSCYDWVRIPCSENRHYGESGCTADYKGATFLVNSCTGTFKNVYASRGEEPVHGNYPVLMQTPCDPIGGIGILGPKRQHLIDEKNCEELKRLTKKNEVKSALQDLETKLSSPNEEGYSLNSTDPNNEVQILPSGTPTSIRFRAAKKFYGAMHSHPANGKATPMFSAGDIVGLYTLAKFYNTNGEDLSSIASKFVVTVTTAQGTYAIKIDSMSFVTIMDSIKEIPNGLLQFKEDLDNIQRKAYIFTPKSHQRRFLEFLQEKKIPISLYKVDNNFTDWSKLSLDGNNVVSKNCN